VDRRTYEEPGATVGFGPVPEAFKVLTDAFDSDAGSPPDAPRPAEARDDVGRVVPKSRRGGSLHHHTPVDRSPAAV